MSRALNRHNKRKFKKKEHPAARCSNAKCTICHSGKVIGLPTRKLMREDAKLKS